MFRQSIYEKRLQYQYNNLSIHHSLISGERDESGDCQKAITIPSDIEVLPFDNSSICHFEHQSNCINKFFRKFNLKVSSIMLLHNENITVNNCCDRRNYGYLRIAISDGQRHYFVRDYPMEEYNKDHVEWCYANANEKCLSCFPFHSSFKIDASLQDVILSYEAAGYFFHEVLGHFLEEDYYSAYAVQNNVHNIKIPNSIRMIDNISGYQNIIGMNKIDDLGTQIQPVTIISDGKILNTLSMNAGFARRQNYKFSCFPRMRSSLISCPIEGNALLSQENMINSINSGIFIHQFYGGTFNVIDGNYTLLGSGYKIENACVDKFIGNIQIKGNIQKDLNKIISLSKTTKYYATSCAKGGQIIRLGFSAPSIHITDLEVMSSEI